MSHLAIQISISLSLCCNHGQALFSGHVPLCGWHSTMRVTFGFNLADQNKISLLALLRCTQVILGKALKIFHVICACLTSWYWRDLVLK